MHDYCLIITEVHNWSPYWWSRGYSTARSVLIHVQWTLSKPDTSPYRTLN